ncbi:MAG: hypothetical protein RIS70_2771 [Planctomycetota bacterium]|jgi:predicted phosphate transport protein (TIGR00153 family)
MFGLLPKNLEFFDCFERAAKNSLRAAELLEQYSHTNGTAGRELLMAVCEAEHAGDQVTHETLDRLEKTYITPIDRDDIHRLITKIDDVVDTIEAIGQRIMFYKIDVLLPDFRQQCAVLVKSTRLMLDAVMGLRSMKDRGRRNNGVRIEHLIIAVHEAEEEGDTIHHRVLAELFEIGLDAFQVIKWKELYELVEQAIDYCDDVANIIHGIVLKNM